MAHNVGQLKVKDVQNECNGSMIFKVDEWQYSKRLHSIVQLVALGNHYSL